MNLLITGANGFVGKNLINFFLEKTNYNLTCISKKNNTISNQRIFWIKINEFDNKIDWKKILIGIDCIIHLAGPAHSDNNKNQLKKNYEATKELAKNAIKYKIKKFIFLSTIKVNGEFSEVNKPFTIKDKANPQNIYSVTKYKIENMLNSLYTNRKLSLVIIRPPIIYGPYVKANFKSIIQMTKLNIPLPFKNLNNKRSFVSTDNLSDLILKVVDCKDYLFETFFVSDENDISTNELITKISVLCNKKIILFNLPILNIGFLLRLICLKKYLDKMYLNLQLDIKYTKETMRWEPKYTMDYALKKTIASHTK